MADKTTIIESEKPPAQTPPSDRVIDLAVEVGTMRAERAARDSELAQTRAELAETRASVESLRESVSSLSRQTESAERTAEAAATVAVATAEAQEEEEEEEDQGGVLEVTPEVETRVEITQTPIKGRSILQKMFFGR